MPQDIGPLTAVERRQIKKRILVASPNVRRLVKGKGFSYKELENAGIPMHLARKIGLPIDKRRKTMYEHNVAFLREILDKFNINIATQVKPQAPQPAKPIEEKYTPAPSTPIEEKTVEYGLEDVCESLISIIEQSKRKKRETLYTTFYESMKKFAESNKLEITDDEIGDLLNVILNDLSIAGYGKLTEKFFSKLPDWDSTMAREMILERLRMFLENKK